MAAIITKHLEYVAELESTVIRFAVFCERTAALAKRALETDLGAFGSNRHMDVKTLELLVPTMSLETFKRILSDANVELVQLFLEHPSTYDNYAIRIARQLCHSAVFKAR